MRNSIFNRVVAVICLMTFVPAWTDVGALVPPAKKLPKVSNNFLSHKKPAPGLRALRIETPTPQDPRASLPPPTPLTDNQLRTLAGKPQAKPMGPSSSLPPARMLLTKLIPATTGLASSLSVLTVSGAVAEPVSSSASAAEALAAADALKDSGDRVGAALGYLQVLDNYSRTDAAVQADVKARELGELMMHGQATPEEIARFEQEIPSVESMKSVEARFFLADYFHSKAQLAEKGGDTARAASLHQSCLNAAHLAMALTPEHPLQVLVVRWYYDAAAYLGRVKEAAGELTELVRTTPPGPVKWGAMFELGNYEGQVHNNPCQGFLYHFDMVQEMKKSLDTFLADSGITPLVRAWLEYMVAEADYDVGFLDEALTHYDHILATCPDTVDVFHMAHLAKAAALDWKHPVHPVEALTVFGEYLARYPNGPYVDAMLNRIASIYYRVQDYASAVEVYQTTIDLFPGSASADGARKALATMADNHLFGEPAPSESRPQLCGPITLQRMLSLMGVTASLDDLVRWANSDENGTTMMGLIQAARRAGVELQGVQARQAQQLKPPFIAFVNGNHFVLVTVVADSGVFVADLDGPEVPMTNEQFAAIWDGKALIAAPPVVSPLAMNETDLDNVRGGTTPPDFPSTVPGNCVNANCCCTCPCTDGPPAPPRGGALFAALPHSPGFPTAPINAPTAGAIAASAIQVIQGAQYLHKTDLSFPVKGGNKIAFSRTFFNRWGQHTTEMQGSAPWENNIGPNWVHNYNTRVQLSQSTMSNGAPELIIYYQEDASFNYFTHASAETEYDSYVPMQHKFDPRRTAGTEMYCYTSQGDVTQVVVTEPNGMCLGFSYPAHPDNKTCRLNWIDDISGNRISLSYDGTPLTGKLTKVTPPSPANDPRYLKLSYSGNLIATACITKDSASEPLASVSYEYGDGGLTKVTGVDGRAETYTYATCPEEQCPGEEECVCVNNTYYMASSTDKYSAGVSYVFQYDHYLYGNTTMYQPTKIVLTHPDNSVVTYSNPLVSMDGHIRNSPDTLITVASSSDPDTPLRTLQYHCPIHGYFVSRFSVFSDPDSMQSTKSWRYAYDENYALTSSIQPNGVTHATYTYLNDGSGRISTVANADGATRTYEYDGDKRDATKITEPDEIATYYLYDSNRRLLSKTNAAMGGAGKGYRFAYNGSGLLTTVTDPMDHATTMAYDSVGNLASITKPGNVISQMVYDDFGRVVTKIDPRGKSTYYSYAGYGSGCGCGGNSGKLTKVQDAEGAVTEFEYNDDGLMTKQIDAMEHEMDIVYDAMNRPITRTFPSGSGQHTISEYDLLGRMTKVTDPTGKVARSYYDYMDRVLTKSVGSNPEDITERHLYDDAGNLTYVYDGSQHVFAYAYDACNRLTLDVDSLWKSHSYVYGSTGRILTKSDAFGYEPTYYSYDGDTGRLTTVQYVGDTDTKTVNYEYNDLGQMVHLNDWMGGDGNGNHYFDYDALGRLTKYRDFDDDPNGTRQTMAYAYDAAGNLVTKTDYEGGVFTYTYTDRNQVSTITAPEDQAWVYTYNALGQPLLVTNPNSTYTYYLYDDQNRQTAIWDFQGLFNTLDYFSYTLDASGNILTATNTDESQWEYGYDQRNRLTTATRLNRDTNPDIVAEYGFTYDAADNLVTKTGPYEDNFNDGSLSDWDVGSGTWDASNFYLTKTSSGQGQINLYHSDGNFDAWFSYYCDSEPDYMLVRFRMADWSNYLELLIEGAEMQVGQWVSGTPTVLDTNEDATTETGSWYTVHIQCDGYNVKVWRIEEGNPPEQVFDLGAGDGVAITDTDRLNFQVGAGATFAIDDVRLVSDSLSKTTTFAYNNGNELTSETSGAMTKTYTYDALGRRSTKAQAGEGLEALYAYGYDNKLQAVTSNFPDEEAWQHHLYDGLGKLRESVSPGTGNATWLRWDKGWNPVGMYPDASGVPGALNIGFVHHPQQDAAPPLSYRLFDTGSSALFNFYGAYDNIGSLRALRWDDENVTSVGAAEYVPYGQPYDQSMMVNFYGYAGHFFDPGIGMSFAPYRWYDPEIARWMTRDPLGMIDGLNIYAYVGGDPVTRVDFDGAAWTTLDFISWYYLGNGRTVNLSSVGLLSYYKSDSIVTSIVNSLHNKAAIASIKKGRELLSKCGHDCDAGPNMFVDRVVAGVHGQTMFSNRPSDPLYVLGGGDLYGNATCVIMANCSTRTFMYQCNANFSQNDMFKDPIDLRMDAPNGTPYDIIAMWSESFSGSGS